MAPQLALIGCGEAGTAFATAGRWQGHARAFDIIASRAAILGEIGIEGCNTARAAIAGAEIVLSLVTAGEALSAAREAALAIRKDALYCDLNSVAPETKREAAGIIEAAGGRYVDVAVLAPVEPACLAVPLHLSGPAASEAGALLTALGFTNVLLVGDEVGRASAIKMIRSVMVKGIEALTDEMMAAARAAGVTDEVLASLDASERPMPWERRTLYNLERMTTHGLRRAGEMEEAAKTLRSLGVDPVMTAGTICRQRDAASTPATRDAA